MTAVPRVSVRSSVRMPIRPRVGTWNSRRTRPEPWFTIFDILPLRRAIFSSTTPMYVSGRSMLNSSSGSLRTPSSTWVMTSGFEIAELEALAAHGLDQDRELQLAAAEDLEATPPTRWARRGSRRS